jgi:hypothetical protein
MKQAITVTDKGTELTENTGPLSFAVSTSEIDRKISLYVFGESGGHNFSKKIVHL